MRTIVVIDPDLISGPLTERFLKNYNFNVSLFDEATKAVDNITQTRPDVVVVEHDMVGLNGLDVADLLHKMIPDLATILLTNEESEVFTLEAQQHGVSRVVSKSSEYVNLPHIVSQLLNIDLDQRKAKYLTNL